MALDNNKTAIVRNWKEKWEKHGNVEVAQKVEAVTGEYPDSDMYVSKSIEQENPISELELIQESIKNNTPIIF